jgi:hypothetical protein
MRPFEHNPDVNSQMVSYLLLPDGNGWNEEKLWEIFYDADVENILNLPIGHAGTVDILHGTTPRMGYSVLTLHTIFRLN